MVSPVDPDVRWGAKSDKKKFPGYKAHTTMTDRGFVTNIEVTPGNVTDDKPAVPLAEHQKERHGIVPKKMRGDGAYGTIDNRKDFKVMGTQLVAPEKTSNSKGGFPKDRFEFDEENGIMTCPVGMKTTVNYYNEGTKSHVYHFDKAQCGPCRIKEKCTKRAFRTVSIHEDYAIQQEAKRYNETEEYKEDVKMRAHIEPKNAEMKRFHGLKRAFYRGLERVNIQAIYTAIVVNLKRMVTVVFSVSSRSKAFG
jgi:transposase